MICPQRINWNTEGLLVMSVGTKMEKKKKKKKISRFRVIGLILISFVVLISSVVLWQLNEGKRLAEKLTDEAVQSAQRNSQEGKEDETLTGETSHGNEVEVNPPAPTESSASQNPEVDASGNPSGTQGEGNVNEPVSSTSGTGTAEISYKELVASTYSNTLQTMETVKANTLALQSRGISLAGYRASISQARQNFATYEKFLLTNPPTDPALKVSYQDFLSGVTIARDSMDVVLSGISSLNPSSLYAAKDMGKTARDKVVSAYRNF